MLKFHGYTVRINYGSDRPDYEADLKNCHICGRTFFLCDTITKRPLPADLLMHRCTCGQHVCSRCKQDLRNGVAVCKSFQEKADTEEEQFDQARRLGSWDS